MTVDLWLKGSHDVKSAAKPQERTASTYVQEAKVHIRKNNLQDAYSILQTACVLYPDNPLLLSYYGTLHAMIGKKYRAGIELCCTAIALVASKSSIEPFILSELHLNLGRTYLAADMRGDSIRAFLTGLRYDKTNKTLLKELQACDRRAKPLLPFLDRSNPFNKYSGLALRRNIAGGE
jgi:tetratricopeptide (TPR) repeat protein